MTFFTTAEVDELREMQESSFADTCIIADPSHKAVGGGQEWTARTAVPCAASSPSRALATGLPVLDLGGNEQEFVFSLPVASAPVVQGARITWQSRTFEVKRSEQPGTYDMQLIVNAVERAS